MGIHPMRQPGERHKGFNGLHVGIVGLELDSDVIKVTVRSPLTGGHTVVAESSEVEEILDAISALLTAQIDDQNTALMDRRDEQLAALTATQARLTK